VLVNGVFFHGGFLHPLSLPTYLDVEYLDIKLYIKYLYLKILGIKPILERKGGAQMIQSPGLRELIELERRRAEAARACEASKAAK
jgi:hypothetical protein